MIIRANRALRQRRTTRCWGTSVPTRSNWRSTRAPVGPGRRVQLLCRSGV